MHTGMLWWDDSDKPLKDKIDKGVKYYQKKYGRLPNLILVHPSVFQEKLSDTLTVRPYRPVLPGHIWIGMEDKDSYEKN